MLVYNHSSSFMNRIKIDKYPSFVKFFIIPGALLLLWAVLSLFFSTRVSFSIIEDSYGKYDFTPFTTQRLLKDQTVTANFRAGNNNLGAVRVRFNTFHMISTDY